MARPPRKSVVFTAGTDPALDLRENAPERDQAALRTALLEQRAIVENAPVGIMLAKPGRFKSCNSRMAEMLGYAREELADRGSTRGDGWPRAGERILSSAF